MFKIYCTKDVIEDNFTDGEVGKMYTTMYWAKIGSSQTLTDCKEKICEYLSCKNTDIELDEENNVFIVSRLETEEGDEANEYEINKWKKNEYKLFSAYFSFSIIEENEVILKNRLN